MFKVVLLFIIFTFFSICSHGQVDFNNYQTLKSKGPVPEDFSTATYQKIQADMTKNRDDVSENDKQLFLKKTRYAIDDLLHSGAVTFGDTVSNYVTAIAKLLLKDHKDLNNELRFYTIKSNIANAFSSDQGIIFVTTGLISQLENEAQLAYILSHEIAHYSEKHVVETFNWTRDPKNDNDDWISDLSLYAKEHELEADKMALELYSKAGYSKGEIIGTFDVLLYSYLPFDEVKLTSSYFNSDYLFFPEFLLPQKEYEIKADEDKDDTYSSHPNIRKRKTAVSEELKNMQSSWGNKINFFPESFDFVRTVTRFERVRSYVLSSHYVDALYTIFLLEQEFPNSLFLERLKAQAWLGCYQYRKANILRKITLSTNEYEGESAAIHFMTKSISRKAFPALAMRQIVDAKNRFPEDAELAAIYQFLIQEIGKDSHFEIENYKPVTFQRANEILEEENKQLVESKMKDSIANVYVDSLASTKELSKYDRIKSKRKNADKKHDSELTEIASIDTSHFYQYALSDIVNDSSFLEALHIAQENNANFEKRKREYDEMSSSQRKRYNKNNRHRHIILGIDSLIIVEPKVFSYGKRSFVDPIKSEHLEEAFEKAIDECSEELSMKITQVNSNSIGGLNSEKYNERSAFLSCFRQVTNNMNIHLFPVDYTALSELRKQYGTSNVMFPILQHSKRATFNWFILGFSSFLYPTIPLTLGVYIPLRLLKANHLDITFIIMDINKGTLLGGDYYETNDPISKHGLGAHIYNILSLIKSTPN